MENQIRVRFAPSPTGYLHIGGLRTALYNYLYAKKTGGKFILRIEDTDRNRYVKGAVENLISTLKAVGLDYDEGPDIGGEYGPYFQSERLDIYQKYVDELLEKDMAYPCFCTPEDLDKMRKEQLARGEDVRYDRRCRNIPKEEARKRMQSESYVIRLKVPLEGEITFYDVVRDKVTIAWSTVDDQILLKSDGFPTYHLANVVDDHLMKISHIIRGEEWLYSVPKHLFLYRAFGWKPPKMVHLPLLLNKDKSKLSKRQNDVAAEDYLRKGFIKEALINYIALLGWHPKGNKEIFTMKELIKEFSLKRINKAGAVFDVEKLLWMSGFYLRKLDKDELLKRSLPFFEKAGIDVSDKEKLQMVLSVAKDYARTLEELAEVSKIYYLPPDWNNEQKEILRKGKPIFDFWIDELLKADVIDKAKIDRLIKETTEKLNLKGKDFYFPLRLALYGNTHGPDIHKIIFALKKQETLKRLERAKSI